MLANEQGGDPRSRQMRSETQREGEDKEKEFRGVSWGLEGS